MCEVNVNNLFYDESKDQYPEFEESVRNHFNSSVKGNKKLFRTNANGLYEAYLNNLPEESKQHYTCNACKGFLNKYGSLVTISENGEIKSALWNEDEVPQFFAESVKAMKEIVLKSKVNNVFSADNKILGHPVTGEWTHLSVKLPSGLVNTSRLLTAGQVMAEKEQDFKMLTNALLTYSLETVEQALALIQSETMYRSDRVLGIAQWFKELIEKRNSMQSSTQKTNVAWLAVGTAPSGFTHVKSSMIGTLLDDIQDGLSTETVAARFAEKMNPSNYQRSQSAPSENSIFEAEQLVEKLGIANSLQRRYAIIDEIPSFLWKNKETIKNTEKRSSNGVFSQLTAKAKTQNNTMTIPSSVMTWEKFKRTILPTADKIEALTDNPNRFMALVTAADNTSENILQWGNPFSWYYHGGVDGEIRRRVEEAGGRYENNEIRASLIWEGLTDLDLHCVTPRGEHIYYNDKRSRDGGYLDLDMNGIDRNSETPVENMRWSDNAPEGHYKFFVHNYSEKVNGFHGTPFRVELEINGMVYHYEGKPLTDGNKVTVFEFDYIRGQNLSIHGNIS